MILAHHEILFLAQGSASVGLAGWAAAIGARWYSITHNRSKREPFAGSTSASRVQGDETT